MKTLLALKLTLAAAPLAFTQNSKACSPLPQAYTDRENMNAVMEFVVSANSEFVTKLHSVKDVSTDTWRYKVEYEVEDSKAGRDICKTGIYSVVRDYIPPKDEGRCPELKSINVNPENVTVGCALR